MNVYLSFDVEVWCNGWTNLDAVFPQHFERYVFGRSAHGDYALPKTLEILNRHGLKGVFFVEPLFAARFGRAHLETIVRLIRDAGQEVQLHIHPEWTDEIAPPILDDVSRKRQHLAYYTLDEQTRLIGFAKKLLEDAGSGPITAFRAGSFAANRDTFTALSRNGIFIDSSLNRCYAISAPELRAQHEFIAPFAVDGVITYPVSVFKDGFGRERPAQVGACGFDEMRDALRNAAAAGMRDFVILSHNFEMLKPDTAQPDRLVVKRFERLCSFLAQHQDSLPVCSYPDKPAPGLFCESIPHVGPYPTIVRHIEQLVRRFA